MGTFNVSLQAGDPAATRFVDIDALVDAGASHTSLPTTLLRDLGVAPRFKRRFILATGASVTKDVGQTWVRLDGREAMTVVVFDEDAAMPLLGAVTLEEMGPGVDPLARRLVEVPGLLT